MKRLLLLLLLVPGVFGVTFDEARDAYVNSTLLIENLKSLKYPTTALEDALVPMRENLYGMNISKLRQKADILWYSGEPDKILIALQLYAAINASLQTGVNPGINYSFVVEKAEWIKQMREKAFMASDLLSDARDNFAQVNETLDLTVAKATFDSAEISFDAERYDEVAPLVRQALDQLEDARVEAARERAFMRLARRNVVNYVEDHWRGLLTTLAVLLVLFTWFFLEVRAFRAFSRMHRLRIELRAVLDAMRAAQEEYFTGNTGSGTYKRRMDLYHAKQRRLKTDLHVWEKLAHLYKKRTIFARFKRL
jgi:hypothetical protein